MTGHRSSSSSRACRFVIGILLGASTVAAMATDHVDAPVILHDRDHRAAGLFAFVGTHVDQPSRLVLNVLLQTRTYGEPGSGPLEHRIDEALRYNIHITDPVDARERIVYRFQFAPIASADAATSRGSLDQTFTLLVEDTGTVRRLGTDLLVAPPNPGPRTTPHYNDATGRAVSGAQIFAELDEYTRSAIHRLPSGEVAFAGPREDGFYADLAGLSDLLDPRVFSPSPGFPATAGQGGGGPDTMRGFNVAVIGLQIPLEALVNVAAPFTARHFGQSIASHGVGVWASVEAAVPIGRGNSQRKRTDWEQVARVGQPLFAMTILDATERARYATSRPEDDAQFATHAESPAIAGYINRYHSPPLDPLQTGGRSDLVALLIPDLLRVDLTTGPVPLPGMTGFNRLGMLAGDITLGRSSGWPNGRRIGDDVVDIYLTALASGPGYGAMRLFGDNVAANDQLFNQVFPYLGTPHSGVANR